MKKVNDTRWIQIVFFLSGLLLLATGINLMITAPTFGLSPWDSFFIALTDTFGMTLGFWMFLLNVFFLVVVLCLKRERVTLSTIVIVFLISIFVDGVHFLAHDAMTMIPDLVAFSIGALCIGYGIGIYVSSSIAVAPQEAFMLTVSEKIHWSYQRTEIVTSLIVLSMSYALDGPIYYGTLILAVVIGLIIQKAMNQSKRLLTILLHENKGELK